MKKPMRLLQPTTTILLALSSTVPFPSAMQTEGERHDAAAETHGQEAKVVDVPIEPFRLELLELAYDAVSRFPLHPHVKNRSRAQEEVAVTAMELDQPRLALRYFEGIENWRRGVGYASFALYCAKHGDAIEARHYLDIAEAIVDSEEIQEDQTWRRDRIRAKIALTHRELGDDDAAAAFEANLGASETQGQLAARAERMTEGDFDFQMAAIDEIAQVGSFELVQNALALCVELYDRFYENDARRAAAGEKLRTSWSSVPLSVRIDMLGRLAEIELEHGDGEAALAIVDEARALFDQHTWTLEFHLPIVARLAELRFRAGKEKQALQEARAAIATFEERKQTLQEIFHADALVPLAAAFARMDAPQTALEVYGWALDAGARNPNARPRAEDLLLVCCSMAATGTEPDDAVWERLRKTRDGLVDPW